MSNTALFMATVAYLAAVLMLGFAIMVLFNSIASVFFAIPLMIVLGLLTPRVIAWLFPA